MYNYLVGEKFREDKVDDKFDICLREKLSQNEASFGHIITPYKVIGGTNCVSALLMGGREDSGGAYRRSKI
ncbi:hypothetical protein TorRG33x02_255240 [Trema orientale]|uniref:Uncharacterized protein n=1 Tax=Trema orientale TaxID=63057 RepID=A0A2P5DD65_TREOI|nr:hypothetical protein TorRG33x02_255240 [Trema orientale]